MEKFKLTLQYTADGKAFSTSAFATEHFTIQPRTFTDHIRLDLTAKTPIEITSLRLTFPFTFHPEDRVFLNGYQSWTASCEHFINDAATNLNPLCKPVIEHSSFSATGDYNFVKADTRAGYFHGFSYAYVRTDSFYNLFASLNERTGYTIFRLNCPENTVTVEKDLEGVTIEKEYSLLDIIHFTGDENSVFDRWFSLLALPKCTAPRKNGYTTWYNYYPNINASIIQTDLKALSETDADIDIFQIDDGYQSNTGDWLSVDKAKFPNGLKPLAAEIHNQGIQAGLWLAPFAAQYLSEAAEHPQWLIRDKQGVPIRCGMNWGGFYALDIEYPRVRAYIQHCLDVILNDWGFDLVKLDFLYAACIIPNHGKSRGQLMCEAMDFLRECVGDKQILACGVPLFPAFGKVEYCRIGADMGLSWATPTFSHREIVSTKNALCNTIFRRQLDNRAFRNDPDVFLLREDNMKCTFEQRQIIATINKLFGSVLFTSDNVGKYNQTQMLMLLNTFKKDDIQILRAEFSEKNRDVLEISYLKNGQQQHFAFHLKRGKILS